MSELPSKTRILFILLCALGLLVVNAPNGVAQAAQFLVTQMGKTNDPSVLKFVAQALQLVATKMDPEHAAERCAQAVQLLLTQQLGHTGGANFVELVKVLKSVAPKLDKRELVEVLKHPSCVDQARQMVLQELSKRTKQNFSSTWQFVVWAEKHEPDLDLRSPLKLPDEYSTQAPRVTTEPTVASEETVAPQPLGSVLYPLVVLFLWLSFVTALTASLLGLHRKGKLPTLSATVHTYAYLGLLALFALGGLLAALLIGIAQFSFFSVFPALLLFALMFILLPSVSVVVPAWLLAKRIPARCPKCSAKLAYVNGLRPIAYMCRSCEYTHRTSLALGKVKE